MAARADLTDDLDLTLALLDAPWDWRHRLHERLEVGPSHHLRVTSDFQFELPPGLMQHFVAAGTTRVRALLPLTMRPKRLLIGFRLEGPIGEPVYRLLRPSIAAIQAEYLRTVVERSPAAQPLAAALPGGLREAICVFTPAIAERIIDDHWPTVEGLAEYLRQGLPFNVDPADVERWHDDTGDVGALLSEAVGEARDPYSSSENILLALPLLDPPPSSPAEVDAVVTAYRHGIEAAAAAGDLTALALLCDYGKRWEVIVEAEAPLDEPFSIRVLEERPVEVRWRGWIDDIVALGDARTVHVEARVTDPDLEIATYDVSQLDALPIGIPVLEAVRDTPEVFAVYTSEEERRPHFVEVRLRLRLRRHILLARWAIEALVLSAALAALLYPHDRDPVGAMGVITLPATFAVAVLLTRETSPMTGRIERFSRWRLLVWVAALLAIVGWRLFTAHAPYNEHGGTARAETPFHVTEVGQQPADIDTQA
jgi:hypothetical protein